MNKKRSGPLIESDDDEDAGDEPAEYVVEEVLGERRGDTGVEYLLKWQGFPMEEATWEPKENVSCFALIEEYKKKKRAKSMGASTSKDKKEKGAEMEKVREKKSKSEGRKVQNDSFSKHKDKSKGHSGVKVIGLRRDSELKFLIQLRGRKHILISSDEAYERFPQEVLLFYEEHLEIEKD